MITAYIVFKLIPETRPEALGERRKESFLETLSGYRLVMTDRLYLAFLITSMLMLIVYQQMYNTLSVYLRDVHGVPTQGYGFMLSLDAGTVVLFQFWITRRIKRFKPMKIMAWGMVIYAVGFSMYGYVSTVIFFVIAMVIITIAEMLVTPVSQAIVAKLSPEDMRGRYMAVFGFSWTIPTAVGPLAAGLIMDNYNPNWVWFAAGPNSWPRAAWTRAAKQSVPRRWSKNAIGSLPESTNSWPMPDLAPPTWKRSTLPT